MSQENEQSWWSRRVVIREQRNSHQPPIYFHAALRAWEIITGYWTDVRQADDTPEDLAIWESLVFKFDENHKIVDRVFRASGELWEVAEDHAFRASQDNDLGEYNSMNSLMKKVELLFKEVRL